MCLLTLMPVLACATPQVVVRSQLLGADSAVVGAQVTLQVDVLVDTWFAAPPELPRLDLPDAVVSAPSGEAVHLNEELSGVKLFGLRFNYRITPQAARDYSIPALSISVQPGQSDSPQIVATTAQQFRAEQPQGASPGEWVLVAEQVEFSQTLEQSHTPLRPGDSVTRRLVVRATGAQAMLIPAPLFVPVDGLSLSVQPASVHPLDNGRGATLGGVREDVASYRPTRAGSYQLPPVSLRWWSTADRQMHTASVPAATVQAQGAEAYTSPFSVAQDLRQLRRGAQIHIARYWPMGLVLLAAVAAVGYGVRQWAPRAWQAWQSWRARRPERALAYRLKPLNPRTPKETSHG